jgi:hypothetical protein
MISRRVVSSGQPKGVVRVRLTILQEDGEVDVEAISGEVVIGYARGNREDDRLQLLDFHVEQFAPPCTDFPPGTPLRGRGIGTALLARFLQEADAGGIRETWGNVTQDDIDETPHLRSLYEKHGFILREPDDECESNAVKKIVRRR